MSDSQELNDQLRSLLDQWTEGLSQVLESMTDQKAEVKWEPGLTLASDPEALWWEQPFQVSRDCMVWVAAPRVTWEHAGEVTLKAAGLETVETNEARNTWLEILGQSLSVMARSMSTMVGREVTCDPGREHTTSSTPEPGAAVSIKFPDRALPPLWIGFSQGLISFLAAPPPVAAEEEDEEPGAEIGEEIRKRTSLPPTMDLILDVELPVSISFGKTEMAMKDVLKLTTGSIVELNRGVNDPVEVMVNHCLIARGEVVVVEGNYGVRIQYIASRQDRIRSVR